MNRYTVIIPSCTLTNTQACLQSIYEMQPDASVIVVANGDLLGHQDEIDCRAMIHEYREPFNFSRAINQAADECQGRDLLILNDDTRLLTQHGFSRLNEAAYDHPECGLMFSAVTGCTGNPKDHLQQPGGGVRHAKRHVVPFVGVYIRRAIWDQIGPMDEQYCLDYGVEDNDYCYRVTQAGYKLGIYDGCLLEHGVLPSAYRSGGARPFTRNAELFRQKHGVSLWDLP